MIEWVPENSMGWAPTMRQTLEPAPVLGKSDVIDLASDRASLLAAMREILEIIADHECHTHDRLRAAQIRASTALEAVGVQPQRMPRRLF